MANANLFQEYLRPPKSVLDYSAEMDKADSNALSLVAQRQQNAVASQDFADQNAIRRLYASGIDLGSPEGRAQLYAAAPTKAGAILSQQGAIAKTAADTAHTVSQTATGDFDLKLKKADKAISDIASFKTAQEALAGLQAHAQAGDIDPQRAQTLASQIPQDPAQFPAWQVSMLRGIMSAKDQLESQKLHFQSNNTGGAVVTQALDPITGKPVGQTSLPTTQSPDNIATNATHVQTAGIAQAGENARSALARQTQLKIAGMGPEGQGEGVSPAAIENAAARYNVDGTLPPMGMGASGAAGRRAILNRAAELAMGTSGTDQRVNQLDAKSAASGLTQLTKAKTMASSFERTANANASLALGLSGQLDRSGVPLLNAGLQAWRTGTGSPEATQFAAANDTFTAEYAKIMSGGMGSGPVSDSARAKAQSLLQTSMTKEQYAGNVKLLQTEMANRMKGFDDEEKALRGRLGATPAAQPAAPALQIDQAAIAAELKKRGPK